MVNKFIHFLINPIVGAVSFLLGIVLIITEVREIFLITFITNHIPVWVSSFLLHYAIIVGFINFIIWALQPAIMNYNSQKEKR